MTWGEKNKISYNTKLNAVSIAFSDCYKLITEARQSTPLSKSKTWEVMNMHTRGFLKN